MTHVARRRPLGALLCCASVAAVALGLGAPRKARAQAFQGVPTIASGDASVSTGANTTDVLINSDQVVIDWKAAATGSGAIDFLPAGATATFQNDLYFTGTTFTVLNRILPVDPLTGAAVNQAIAFNGTVQSQINGVTAGNVWFYSPNGIIAGPTSVFNVGSLVLTTNPIDTTGGLYGANGEIRFGTPVAGASIQIQPGAQINALMDNSYVAMVSPRIEQGGNVQVNGSTAYVAAEQADVTINDGLFDIQIGVGADDPNGIVHTGKTGGPATSSTADFQRIYMVAMPKNDALTMLLSGTIGYTPATVATDEAGAVVLSAGANVVGGYAAPDPAATADAGIAVSDADFTSALSAYAADGITVSADGGQQVRFERATTLAARNSATISTTNGGSVAALGDLTVSAGNGATGGDVQLTADGALPGVGQSNIAVTGQLSLDASAAAPTAAPIGAIGGDAAGGTVGVAATDGGAITAGSLVARANAIGGFGTTSEGDATGGAVTIAADKNGSISAGAVDAETSASVQDGSQYGATTLAGGSATAGTVTLSSIDSTLAFDATTLLAQASGGMGAQTSGDATGGTIAMSVTGTDNGWGSLAANASVYPGAADAGGVAGRGTAGDVTLDVGGGATLALTEAYLTADTQVFNLGAGGGGNVERGGTIAVSAHDAGNLVVDNGLVLSASGYGEKSDASSDTGAPMSAFGGSISVDANGGAITALQLTADSSAQASGSSGGRATAQGGDVTVAARAGGALHLTGDGESAFTARARGGYGGYGADAAGGTIDLYASDGAIDVDSALLISADATSGGSFSDGVTGGNATGGAVTVENRAGAAGTAAMNFGSLSIASGGDAGVFSEGAFFSGGDGGRGTGGTIAITLTAGTFDASVLDASAPGYGGSAVPAYVGGDGIGGDVTMTLDGAAATIGELSLDSIGQGGLGGRYYDDPTQATTPGEGYGGAVLVTALSGGLTGTDLYLTADGYGGDGGDGFSPSKSTGGQGHGGSAQFVMPADSTANVALDAIDIEATGYGGSAGGIYAQPADNGVGGPAGAGGDGVGGAAGATLDGGALDLASLRLAADGVGADGGESDDYNQDGGDGGAGTGGSATLSLGSGAATIGAITATATGAGGAGGITHSIIAGDVTDPIYGFGPGRGGAGGAGNGGTIDLHFGADPTLASLVIDASGAGGVGGDGGTGGAGGLGAGGAANLTVDAGPLVINDLLTLDAVGAGGSGGIGGIGRGGDGGAATGGDATLTVDGATATLQTAGLAILADAVGGDGGAGGDGAAAVDGAAGGDATGGSATLAASDGGAIAYDGSIQASATATGGAGSQGDGGGAGGNGGNALGGAARVTLDHATLTDTDPVEDTLESFVTADATGGAGGAGSIGAVTGIGGAGGAGSGGTADFSAADSSFVLPIFGVFANGSGGAGGDGGIDDSATPVDGPAGIGGSGRGGAASLSVADDGTGGPTPATRSLAELDIAATGSDGASPDLVSVPDAGVAGMAAITNTIVGTGPGLTIGGSLNATALGASAPAGSGIAFTSTGAPVTVAGDAYFGTDGDAAFSFAGDGALAVDGDMTAAAVGSIDLTHAGQTGSPSGSIQAAAIIFDAGGDITGGLGSVLRATDPNGYVIVRGGGAVAVGDVVAPTDVTLSAYGGSLSAGDVTAGDDVWLGAYGGDPAASVTIGAITSTGAGNDAALTDESLFSDGAGPSGQVVRVTGPGAVTTGAIDVSTGRAVVVADQGAIATGDLSAADGIALLARGDVSTGAVKTPSLFYIGDSALFAPNLPDAYDVTALAAVAPARTSGGLAIGGPVNVGQLIATLAGDASFGAIATTGAATIDSSGGIAGDSLAGGEAVTLTGGAGIALADLSAGGDLTLRALAGAITVSHDVAATGAITAVAQGIDLTATGDLTVDSAQATAGDLALASGGALTLTDGDASGAVDLTGDDGVTAQTLTAGGDAGFTSSNGAVTVASLTAVGDVTAHGRSVALTSPGALDIASVTAAAGDIAVTTGGALSLAQGGATGDVTLLSGGAIAGQTLAAGGDVDLTGDGDVGVASLTAGGQVTAIGRSIDLASPGNLTVASAQADAGDLAIATRGALTLTTTTAAGDVALTGDNGVSAQAVTAGGGASLASSNGGIIVASLTAPGPVIAAGVSVDLTSPGALTIADAEATGGDLAITTANALDVTTGAASGDIRLSSGGALTGQTLTAGGDVGLASNGGDVKVDDLTAGGQVTSSGGAIDIASTGALDVASAEASTGDLAISTNGALKVATGTAAGDLSLAGDGGITGQTLSAGGDANLASNGGAVEVASLTVAGAVDASGTSVALTSPGALTIASARATNGALSLTTGGALSIANGSASGNVALAAAGDIQAQTLSAGGDADLVSSGQVTVANLSVSDQLTASGSSVDLTSPGALDVVNAEATAGDLTLNTGGELEIASGTAAGDIRLAGGGIDAAALTAGGDARLDGGGDGDVTVSALTVGGSVAASGGSIDLTSPGALVVSNAEAKAGDLDLTARGALSVAAASSAGDMALASNDGDVTAQMLQSGGGVTITAARNASLSSLTADGDVAVEAGQLASFLGAVSAPTISVESGDIEIGGGASLGDLASTSAITLTSVNAQGPATIGGDGSDDGYDLSAAEVARLFAHDIGISARPLRDDALGGATSPDIVLSDFTVAGGTNIAADGAFAVDTSGKMRVEGAVALTGLSNDGTLQLAANDAIELVAGSGSIDLADAAGNLGGTLDIGGGSFIAATNGAIADVAAATTIAERDARLAQNDGLALDDGMIRAGTIRLAVSDGAYIQNTGIGALYDQRRGFSANALDIETQGGDAQLVLNGQLTDASAFGGFARGLAAIPLVSINGIAPAAGGQFDPGSTINGCVIAGAAQCSAGNDEAPSYTDIDGQTSPTSPDATQLTPTSLIMIQPFQPAGYPPLIDQPVTGVGNDDMWVPDCRTGQEGAPCPVDGDE